MRTRILGAWVGLAAAAVLIVAVLSAGSPSGVSYQGSSNHGAYALFIRAQHNGVAVVQLTSGRFDDELLPCPYGTNQLPDAPIVNGRFASAEWFWLAPHTWAWLWISGRIGPRGRVTGRIQGPPQCGGRDTFSLRAPRA